MLRRQSSLLWLGANRVYALSQLTSYGSVEEVAALTGELAAFCGVSDHITVVEKMTPEILGICGRRYE